MPRTTSPRTAVLIVSALILAVNALLFGGRLVSWISSETVSLLSFATHRIGWIRSVTSRIIQRGDLAVRVRELEDENSVLQGRIARIDELEREAEAYRQVANITVRPSGVSVQARIFSYVSPSGVWQAVLNVGSDDGIAPGDIVETAKGELIGAVQNVHSRYAVVRRLHDASFEVTARVIDSEVTGLVRSAGDGSLLLHLVRKDEVVAEGARVVTSGDDSFPAGLTIGTVRTVDSNSTTIFQMIKIEPTAPLSTHGFVLVVRP